MTNQFLELKRKFIRIMEEELDQAYLSMLYQTVRALLVQLSMLVVDVFPGTSKIPLWDTVKLFDSRINILLVFGEKVGSYTNACVQPREELTWKTANDPIFVERGLKYENEVTLVCEAANNLPAFLVPYDTTS
jgi:hypothetical protein